MSTSLGGDQYGYAHCVSTGAQMIAFFPADPTTIDTALFGHTKSRPIVREERRASGTEMRIVIVEWRIRKGHEAAFLDYWSQNQVIEDRSGLIGEYLSHVENQRDCQWITLEFGADWTTYVNVGFWSDADAFRRQIGPKINDQRPALSFEHEKHRRLFLCPDRWRVGGAMLPTASHDLVH